MSCDLTNGRLLNACSLGRAGIKTLYFTKFNDFDALTGVTELDGEITSLGADPITIYQFDMEDNVGMFDEALTTDKANGTSFVTQVVTLTLLNIKPADLANINNMKRGRWAIWALDFEGKIRLFGRLRGCLASGGSDVSGAAPGDKKGLDMVLTAVENSYAVFMEDYTTVPFDNFANVTVVTTAAFGAEYQVVYNAMTTPPPSSIASAQNAMVEALVAAGVWAKLDAMWVFAGHTNSGGESLINWLNPGTWDAILNGAPNPTFTALEGIKGDGVNGYADLVMTPVDGVNFQLNSGTIGVYSRTNEAAGTAQEMGSYQTGSHISMLACRFTGDELEGVINSTAPATYAVTDSLGFNAISRRDSADLYPYKNGTEGTPTARASASVGNVPFYACAYRLGGSASGFSSKQLSLAFVAAGLVESELDAFFNAFETYMDSNGKGVVT